MKSDYFLDGGVIVIILIVVSLLFYNLFIEGILFEFLVGLILFVLVSYGVGKLIESYKRRRERK